MIKHFKKYWAGYGAVLLFFVLLYSMLKEDREMKLLQHSKVTYGYLIEEYHESAKFRHGFFYFYAGNERIEIKEFRYFSHLSKGDTVLIEYAIEDPTLARVKDKYYMQKYRHLM
jgi:hypothetical protein